MNGSKGVLLPTLLRALLLVPVLLALSAGAGTGQSRERSLPCTTCDSTGKIENPFLKGELRALEDKVLFCSYVIEKDEKGRGLPWIPCPRCKDPKRKESVEQEAEKLRAEKAQWLEARRQVDEQLNVEEPLLHLETEHFIIAWNIPKIVTADKKTYSCHEALHVYADRLEAFYAEFMDFLGLEESEMRNHKHLLFLFQDQKSSLKAAVEFTGLRCWHAAMQPGNPSILVTWLDKDSMPKEADFHRHLVHYVSHLLNVAFYRMEWMAKEAGWADEGLSHFFEMKLFDMADNTCDEEGVAEHRIKGTDWEVDVKKAVLEERGPSFAELSLKTTTTLTGDDHKFAWSFVDFLMYRHRKEFRQFMKAIKEKKPARVALKEAFDLNAITFQSAWETYVMDNYRSKTQAPVRVKRWR